jgi:hypothetical protein
MLLIIASGLGFDSGLGEESSQGPNHPFPDLFLGVRFVKYGSHPVQGNAYTGTSAFRNFGSECIKQRFDIIPVDIGAHRVFENRLERIGLFPIQGRRSWLVANLAFQDET